MASTFNGSHTTPVQASTIRKGGYCMIQGLPCRVTDMSSAKTGMRNTQTCMVNDCFLPLILKC